MSFDIAVKVDPRGAASGIHSVEQGLDRLERKGVQTGEKMSNSLSKFGGALKAGFIAAGGVAAIKMLADVDDRYTELSNHALKFTDAGRNVNIILEDQRRLAHDLHMSLEQTIGAYDGVRDATDDLNLTYDEQIRLTKTLGEAAALGGKSADGAASAFYRLKVAFESGMDTAGALTDLFKQYPDIAAQLQTSLGRTTREIVDMAKSGQISFSDLAHAMTTATKEIDEKFGKRSVTWQQNWDEFKDELLKPIDLQGTIDQFYSVDMAIIRVNQDIAKQVARWKELEDAKNRALVGSYTPTRIDTPEQRAIGIGQARAAEVKEARMQLEGLNVALRQGLIPAFEYERQAAALRKTLYGEAKATEELNKQREEYERLGKALLGSESPSERAIREGAADRAAFQAAVERDARNDNSEIDFNAMRENAIKAADGVKQMQAALDELNKKQLQETFDSAKELGSVFAPAVDTLVDGLLQGELSAKKLEDALSGVAIQLLKMAAIQALSGGGSTGGFLTGILGGKTGFDYTVGNDPLQRPGFATGGDFRVGGTGGTDSRLIQFWATPGESVHVRTPEQRAQAGRAAGASTPVSVTVVAQNNERDIIASGSTFGAKRVFVENMRKLSPRTR